MKLNWLTRFFANFLDVEGVKKEGQHHESEFRAHQMKALEFYSKNLYKEAVREFTIAREQNKGDVNLNLHLIHSLTQIGQTDKAISLIKELRSLKEYQDKIYGEGETYSIVDPLLFTVSQTSDPGNQSGISASKSRVNLIRQKMAKRQDGRFVFSFWHGKDFSLIKILRNLIHRHSVSGKGYEFVLLSRENIDQFVDLPVFFDEMDLAHQADYIRVHVIHKFGGIWLDADTLVIESLDPLFETIESHGMFVIQGHEGVFTNAVFGSKKGYPFLKEWITEMGVILSQKREKIGWIEIGNELLTNLIASKNIEPDFQAFSGKETMYPVFWPDCVVEYLRKPYERSKNHERSFQPLIILVGEVYRALTDRRVHEIFEMEVPLNHFINRSSQNLRLNKTDFIEIGTSSFNTLIEESEEETSGYSIEPIQAYLDKLPERKNVTKINLAITSERISSNMDLFYLPPEYIDKMGLPRWLKGCNSLNRLHPLHIQLGLEKEVVMRKVPVLNIEEFLIEKRIGEVGHLKVDTEGHDLHILKGLFIWLEGERLENYPRRISFESNQLYHSNEVNSLISKASELGYYVEERGENTVLHLE